jgi:hypothetical protein
MTNIYLSELKKKVDAEVLHRMGIGGVSPDKKTSFEQMMVDMRTDYGQNLEKLSAIYRNVYLEAEKLMTRAKETGWRE